MVRFDQTTSIRLVDTLPTPRKELERNLYALKGATGVASEAYICLKDATDAYVMVPLSGISAEVQAALDLKSDVGHNHDTEYYTKNLVDALIIGEIASINARVPAYPMATDRKIDTFTHGGIGRTATLDEVTFAANQMRGAILYLGEETTFKEVGFRVITPGAAGVNARLAIANYDWANNRMTDVFDAGEVDVSTAGDKPRTNVDMPSGDWTWGPGWIILPVYGEAAFGAQGTVTPSSGYGFNTSGSFLVSPTQTGSAYSAYGATENFTTHATSALTTWLVPA